MKLINWSFKTNNYNNNYKKIKIKWNNWISNLLVTKCYFRTKISNRPHNKINNIKLSLINISNIYLIKGQCWITLIKL